MNDKERHEALMKILDWKIEETNKAIADLISKGKWSSGLDGEPYDELLEIDRKAKDKIRELAEKEGLI